MSSKNKKTQKIADELDQLEEEHRQVPENRQTMGRGPDVLHEHLQQAAQRKKQLTMRLDSDIIERFKHLSGPDGSYQTLINRALHEWLEAQSVGQLLQPKLEALSQLIEKLEKKNKLLQERDEHPGPL